jgi:integrase
MAGLRANPDSDARALELGILCASRSGEVLNAHWSEVDCDTAIWTIPGERMKNRKEHRVPLSARAFELLADLPRVSDTYVFVGRGDWPPHQHTLVRVMRNMGRPEVAHGFRTSFRTWAEEATRYRRTSSRWPWRTKSRARLNAHIGAATCSTIGAG